MPPLVQLLLLLSISLSPLAAADTQSTALPERIIWNDQPIRVHITVGQERIVHFPDAIRYWLPDHLKTKLTVLAANGVLYLQAHQDVETTRIRVQDLATQQLYLLDVDANDTQGSTAHIIVLNDERLTHEAKPATQKRSQRDGYERLTRHAAQQLYAPERLLKADSTIKRVALNPVAVPTLLRDPRIQSTILGGWTGGGLFITAIELINTSSQPLALKFSTHEQADNQVINLSNALRGQWLTASVQHTRLSASPQPESITTLYLISDRPFFERAGQ